MKILSFIFPICMLLISCAGSLNNKQAIATINQLPISKKIALVEVDSSDQILDTLSITAYKYDAEGNKRWQKKNRLSEGFQSSHDSYYTKEEDLFYRLDSLPSNYSSIYETKRNKAGKITAATTRIQDGENSYEVNIKFTYTYKKGKISTLFIDAVQDTNTVHSETWYDAEENPVHEFHLMNQDTISKTIHHYKNNKLQSTTAFYSMLDSSKIITTYNEEEQAIKEKHYESTQALPHKEVEYFYDDNQVLQRTVEKNLLTNTRKHFKYLQL